MAANERVAELIRAVTGGVSEVVADKGYHTNRVLPELEAMGVRSYIAEPERARRRWREQAAGGLRQPAMDSRGKRLQGARGEKIERNFAHQFDSGGLRSVTARGRGNVHKKVLLQATR